MKVRRDSPYYSDVPIGLFQASDTPEGERRLGAWLRDNDLSLEGFRRWVESGAGQYYRQKARRDG